METARGGYSLVAVVVLLLAGCAGADGGSSAPSPSTPAVPEFDPPLAFGDRISLGDGYQADAFAVEGGVVHTYQQGSATIASWDLATGEERGSATVELDGDATRASPDGSPYAFTEIDGRTSLVIAYEHFERGVGTRPNEYHLRVRAFHADDGSVAWTRDVVGTDAAEARVLVSNPDHTVVVTGARNPATERVGGDAAQVDGTSTVLETATGEVRQVWEPFVAHALDRDVLAGLHPDLAAADQPAHTLEGRHVYTGETVWEYADAQVSGADYFGYDLGGGAFLQPARSRGTTAVVPATLSTNLVLEVATGELLMEIDHEGAAVECRYDGEQILVCSQDPVDRGGPFLAAYDLHGRTPLWDLAEIDAGRELPSVITAVHRGVVYMEYAAGGRRPVALDARTGTDLAVDLPVAPDQVGPGYGLAYEEPGLVSIYIATG